VVTNPSQSKGKCVIISFVKGFIQFTVVFIKMLTDAQKGKSEIVDSHCLWLYGRYQNIEQCKKEKI